MPESKLVQDIYAVVADDFTAVDKCINIQLTSQVPLVTKIAEYIVQAGGKRLRPLLVLLAARACGYQGEQQVSLAAIIEFLHTATLLHDDVVDTSDLRRGKSTANAKWGNAPSVLVGDFLYSRAFQMMVQLGHMGIMDTLSSATNVIAEGEVMQLMRIRDANTSETDYMQVIHGKTAMLFEASTHTAAQLAGSDPEVCESLRRFGCHLGMAFQLVDDVLDYQGDTKAMGKNIGDDLAEGKPTLPLIYTIQTGSPEAALRVRQAIQKPAQVNIEEIIAIITQSGALDYTLEKASEQQKLATNALAILPPSPYKTALLNLATFAIKRSY